MTENENKEQQKKEKKVKIRRDPKVVVEE